MDGFTVVLQHFSAARQDTDKTEIRRKVIKTYAQFNIVHWRVMQSCTSILALTTYLGLHFIACKVIQIFKFDSNWREVTIKCIFSELQSGNCVGQFESNDG